MVFVVVDFHYAEFHIVILCRFLMLKHTFYIIKIKSNTFNNAKKIRNDLGIRFVKEMLPPYYKNK